MSLIQAALDKTTQSQTKAKPSSPAQASRAGGVWASSILDDGLEKKLQVVQQRAKEKRWFWWKIAVGAVLLIALISWPLFKWGFKSSASSSSARTSFATRTVSRPSTPLKSFSGGFRLSGITEIGNKRRAIINDQIVEVGDRVSKKGLVKEITAREVLLDVNGKDLRLRM